MNFLFFLPNYLLWHYGYALKNFWGIFTNYIWFIYNFFSIKILFRTFFAPWKKMGEDYSKGFDLKKFFSTLVINTMMRLIGVIMRLIVILIGLASLVMVSIIGIIFFFSWLLAPFIVLIFFIFGLTSIIYSFKTV